MAARKPEGSESTAGPNQGDSPASELFWSLAADLQAFSEWLAVTELDEGTWRDLLSEGVAFVGGA